MDRGMVDAEASADIALTMTFQPHPGQILHLARCEHRFFSGLAALRPGFSRANCISLL